MLNVSILKVLCGVVLLGTIAAALNAQKFADFPVQPPSKDSISARQDDVSIGLEPMESVQDQQTYFHTSLSADGFLPVMVVVHNRSASNSLLLDKRGISYGPGVSVKAAPKENSGKQKAVIASAGFVPFLGPFIATGLAEVKQNMVLRELQSGTLSPGEMVHGFLYIPIPKEGPRPTIHIQFPLKWSGSDRTSVLQLEMAATSSDSKLPLNAVLVLTPEFCATEFKQGSLLTTGRESFAVGKMACSELEPALKPVFGNLTVVHAIPLSEDDRIVLIPNFINAHATTSTFAFSNREMDVFLEWTAKDATGKTIWIQTVQGSSEHHMGNMFTHGNGVKLIVRDSVKDVAEQSAAKMEAATELRKLGSERASSEK